jgi:hypothetical protein
MRKRFLALGLTVATAVTLVATGVATATTASASPAKPASINVVHGIPGLTVDVCVNGAKAITNFVPGQVVTGVPLPAGTYHLGVVAAGAPCTPEILMADATLAAGKNYTVVANLDASGTPNLKIFPNNVSRVPEDSARLSIRHTAAAPAVNVWVNGSKLIGGDEFTWGHRKAFVVPEGKYTAVVTLPGSKTPVIGPATLKLKEGYAYQVYAYGSAKDGYGFAVVALKVGEK